MVLVCARIANMVPIECCLGIQLLGYTGTDNSKIIGENITVKWSGDKSNIVTVLKGEELLSQTILAMAGDCLSLPLDDERSIYVVRTGID